MTRREAANVVFANMKEVGFTPTNIQYGDGYFIFDMGEDGVVHFRIKELRGWKFGMWIETDPEKLKNENGEDYPCVQLFCQHTLNIDKFKPSRSFFCVKYSLGEIERDNWRMYKIQSILRMIKRHPMIAFTMDACEDTYYSKSYVMCYVREVIYKAKKNIRDWWRDLIPKIWHQPKVWFINKYKVVDKAEFIDKNEESWKISPRYDMYIHFKKISDDADIQDKAELKMLNIWIRKNYYKNMHVFLSREGLEGYYSYSKR